MLPPTSLTASQENNDDLSNSLITRCFLTVLSVCAPLVCTIATLSLNQVTFGNGNPATLQVKFNGEPGRTSMGPVGLTETSGADFVTKYKIRLY